MDFNDYWQENKRFVTTVAGLAVFFLAGRWALAETFTSDLTAAQGSISRSRRGLGEAMFTATDRAQAEGENESLRAAVEQLEQAVEFEPRPEFRLDPAGGSSQNQYQRAVSRVRDDLLLRANRANLKLDAGLGMPKLSPTREAEIERYLEALDVIDAAIRLAIDAHVQRVDKIQIRLDPGLSSRTGLDRIEETKVELTMIGDSLALTRFLARTQRPAEGEKGRVLRIGSAELVPSRSKDDELRLDATLIIARLHAPPEQEEETED